MKLEKKQSLIFSILITTIVIISILLYFSNQFEEILYSPYITPEEWCNNQPCIQIELFSTQIILVQPTSTMLVYLLGLISVGIGFFLLKKGRTQKFVAWWAISLLLWGLGALFAGSSYQAFSYEIKCAGRPLCIWTSWWEIMYLIFSVGSVDAMMMAQANLAPEGKYYNIMYTYAILDFLGYLSIVIIGSIIPMQNLITFELMVLFLAPSIVIFILFNFIRWKRLKTQIDLKLLLIWVSLIIIMGAYFLYYMSGLTEILWTQGIWFSENDVLHIGLLLWMLYIGISINKFRKTNNPKIA